jgi:hypothetical protein
VMDPGMIEPSAYSGLPRIRAGFVVDFPFNAERLWNNTSGPVRRFGKARRSGTISQGQ